MKGAIIVMASNRRMVLNQNVGWVDRDTVPGPTVYPETLKGTLLPPDQEWEDHEA